MRPARHVYPTTIQDATTRCVMRGWKVCADHGVGDSNDRVVIVFTSHGIAGRCFYNASKGYFCGVTSRGQQFNSDDSAFIRLDWFRDLASTLFAVSERLPDVPTSVAGRLPLATRPATERVQAQSF
jgi:hypothetical protein